MTPQILEFPLFPIPDQPNINGVLYPKAVLDKAKEEAWDRINNEKFLVHQLGLGGAVPMVKDLGINNAIGFVTDIDTVHGDINSRTGQMYRIRIQFLPSYQEHLVNNVLRIEELSFGMITASSLTGFFDRRMYPVGTKSVVESIQEILGVHPIHRETREPITLSQEQVVNEAKRS